MMENYKDDYPALNLPKADLKIVNEGGEVKIFDVLRNKNVRLTPEEFVRQSFINYLNKAFGYPLSLMANEISIDVNGTKKRCDTVVFSRHGEPVMIIEYKAPFIEINQDVFDQIFRYNLEIKAKYLVVSNGMRHYCCKIDYENKTYNFIRLIPEYKDIENLV